jgi:hypothetical protein
MGSIYEKNQRPKILCYWPFNTFEKWLANVLPLIKGVLWKSVKLADHTESRHYSSKENSAYTLAKAFWKLKSL